MLQLGKSFGRSLRPGDTVLCFGELGAGKTTLIRAILTYLVDENASFPSPTFVLLRSYLDSIYHLDLYRLTVPEEFLELDPETLFSEEAMTLVEWPERALAYMPSDALKVHFFVVEVGRRLLLKASGPRSGALLHRIQEDFA